jgi:hypothetical protein
MDPDLDLDLDPHNFLKIESLKEVTPLMVFLTIFAW